MENRLVEVVEPKPEGSGSVFEAGSLQTSYVYDTLGNLTEVNQGTRPRRFKYDSLGRLLAQKMAEEAGNLNDDGVYVGAGAGQWSDFFTYDERSNLTRRVDARGVRTNYNYNNDPLNRLHHTVHSKNFPLLT